MYERACPVCGRRYYSQRSDARYCSHRCRQAAHRMRTKPSMYRGLMIMPNGEHEWGGDGREGTQAAGDSQGV